MDSRAAEHFYDQTFFDYIEHGALQSADVIVPIVLQLLNPRSVLDVGSGAGAWLSVYRRFGIQDVLGIDGDYVSRDRLLIPPECFLPKDLAQPFDLARQFDLAQCLEVAEHLPPLASRTLIRNLVQHSHTILFSAATPGQGGEHHINERPYEYWRTLFAEHDFVAYDAVRPALGAAKGIAPWYAYNTILYVRESAADSLRDAVRRSQVPHDEMIADIAPLRFRLRAAILRRFPVSVVTKLAVLKHRLALASRSINAC